MDDDDKDGDNDNRKNNVVDDGDENEDEGKLNVFFGIPSLLNQDGDENEARSKLTVDGDNDGLSSRSSAVARGTRNLQQLF